jgi:cell fate regulator YaaT (PSP1 superfamily)
MQSIAALPVLQDHTGSGAEGPIVEVAFKGTRRGYHLCDDLELKTGDWVVVDVDRGQDVGRVNALGGVAAKKCSTCRNGLEKEGTAAAPPTSKVLRHATTEEVERLMILRVDEERVRRTARELVTQHSLKMKVTESEWQWDRNKLTIYFTAERRVDFRQLVRDLARTFRTRIELKQIGVRDEAALLGGVGRCGRELCCSTWLREIRPVSLQLAKDQNLSLNPTQISGTCGRLMCCLTYEHDAYLQARKRFPREGKLLRTSRGQEKVIGIDIWHDQVTLLDETRQRRVVALAELKADTVPAGGRGSAGGDSDVPAGGAAKDATDQTRRGARGGRRPPDGAGPSGRNRSGGGQQPTAAAPEADETPGTAKPEGEIKAKGGRTDRRPGRRPRRRRPGKEGGQG